MGKERGVETLCGLVEVTKIHYHANVGYSWFLAEFSTNYCTHSVASGDIRQVFKEKPVC